MKWVFLPGLDGAGIFFEPFLRALPEEIEPVTVAYPAKKRMGYEELLSWLLPQLPQEEPFLVVAESFGGPLAVRVAAEEPKGMIGAVVSASFVVNPLPRLLRYGPVKSFFHLPFPRPLVRWLLADAQAGKEIFELFDQVTEYSPPEVWAHRARAALSVDVTDELKRCRLPLLFLDGNRDRLIPRSAMMRVREIRPDVSVVPVDGPHFLLQLRAETCLEVIERFVDRLSFPA